MGDFVQHSGAGNRQSSSTLQDKTSHTHTTLRRLALPQAGLLVLWDTMRTGLPQLVCAALAVSATLFGSAVAECTTIPELCGVQAAFGGSLVMPQVIPSFEPIGDLKLSYDKIQVGPAQQMAPERLAQQPYVSFNLSAQGYGLGIRPPYVLLAVDPDASAIHTSQSCVLHWMLSDVYFEQDTGRLASGFVSAQYARPNPPESPLHHRYVFLLYEQPMLFLPPVFPQALVGGRLHFNLPLFSLDYGLGSPVAGNFIKSFWTGVEVPEDETAPEKPPMTIQAKSSPFLAAIVGSVLGLVYGASS